MTPQNEVYYAVSYHLLNRLLVMDLITPAELCTAKTRLVRKYQPVIGSLQEDGSSS